MPNKDGTGPEGKGPKTGRRMGMCDGALGICRGNGRRFGGERGRNILCPPMQAAGLSKEEEKKSIEKELEQVQKKKTELETRLNGFK